MTDLIKTMIIGRKGNNNKLTGLATRSYWEARASGYALPFEKESLDRTNRIIRIMRNRGLPIEGAKILDVGCGTGTMALPLAQTGAIVTALDISGNMLKRLAEEARRIGIPEVERIRAAWKRLNPVKTSLSGAFDIVLSSLSVAVETEDDVLKMECCSKQWCVCVASGRIRRYGPCELVMRFFDVPLDPRPDIRSLRRKLKEMGRNYSYDYFTITKKEKKNVGELAREMANRLEAEGKKPNLSRISTTISSLYPSVNEKGSVACRRKTDIGVLIWKADNGDQGIPDK